jgi:hypothetical protein
MLKTQSLYCSEGVFTVPLPGKGSYSIFHCVLVVAGLGLTSCCLAMNVYPDFAILAIGRHVTVLYFL